MSLRLHVAIGSTTSQPGEVVSNLAQIAEFARRAGQDGANLLLTPEMSASGYGGYPEVLATAEPAGQGPIYQELARLACLYRVVICAGFVERAEEKSHLAHYAVYPDGQYVCQRKHRVTQAESPLAPAFRQLPPFNSDGTGQPESVDLKIFSVQDIRCAITICADSGISNLNQILNQHQVRLLLVPTGAGGRRTDCVTTSDLNTPDGRRRYFEILQTLFFPGDASDCITFRRAQAAVNLCGYDGRRHYHRGHGSIINPMGEVVGFFHGLPNLDRQRPMYASGIIAFEDCLPTPSVMQS
jgi:predicted amidohydrolase